MTILDTRDEAHAVVAKMLVKVMDEHIGIRGRQVSAMMVLDTSVGQADDVAADGHVIRTHLITDGGRFQRPSTLIHLVEVITHDRGVGYFRAWREPLRDGDETACATFAGEHVHKRCFGMLERGLPSDAGYGMVCHAVT